MTRQPATIVLVGPASGEHLALPGGGDVVVRVDRADDETVRAAVDAATTDLVVLVTEPAFARRGRWLDELLAVFEDGTVAVAGPLSERFPGAQRLEVDRPVGGREDLRRLERQRRAHRGRVQPAERLVSACVALRRSALADAGPGPLLDGREFDPGLLQLLAALGHRVGVALGAVVHPMAPAVDPDAPLVSAALIVKDEAANLPRCLASLDGVVDEIVVYDTGSTDATPEIARRLGARVVEGHWDDDFSRARNDAAAACRGRWVLAVDADEEAVVPDVAGFRRLLEDGAGTDAYPVRFDNLDADGQVRSRHHHARLYRAERAHWTGRLHEQIEALPYHPALRYGQTEAIWFRHHGYAEDVIDARGKLERNVVLAERGVQDAGGAERFVALTNLVRALMSAHRDEDALAHAREAHALEASPRARVVLLRAGCEIMLRTGATTEAIAWAGELRDLDEPRLADFFEGWARLVLGEYEAAAALLEDTSPVFDASGQELGTIDFVARRAMARLALGHAEEALGALEGILRERPDADLWNPLVQAAAAADVPFERIAGLVPEAHLRAVVTQIGTADAGVAERFAEALWQRFPGDPRVLALGATAAPGTTVERALEWSSRVRDIGLAERCPLVARARRADVPGIDRVLAAAVAHGTYGDERARGALDAASGAVPASAVADAVLLVAELAPDLLEEVVVGLATTAERCERVADVLQAGGAADEAEAVRAFGLALAPR